MASRFRNRTLVSALALAVASLSGAAAAQDAPPAGVDPTQAPTSGTGTTGPSAGITTTAADPREGTQTSEIDDAIVVTGSRIARPNLQASTPVAVVSAQRIQEVAAANIQDVLNTLPSIGQNVSRTSTNFSTSGNGVALLNLRNLGTPRTLTLINGRRLAGIPGSSAVDVNNIPTDLIDRVDVVTGGASAVYGSEAVAGVVNFILKDKFEGLRVRAQNTISDKGDTSRQFVSVTGGKGFADDRGHVVGNFSYDNDHGLRSRNRSFSAVDNPNRSSFASQGLFDVSNADQTQFSSATGRTFTFDPANNLKRYQGANIDGYNRNNDRYLSVPVERYLGNVLANFQFSDAATIYAEGLYQHTNSNSSLEPSAVANTGPGAALAFDGSDYAGIPIGSPYVPQAIRDAAIANGTDVIQFRRRSNDIFSRSNRNARDYYRGVIGLKGDISPKFSYDVYYEHSEGKERTRSQSIYAPNYGAALDNEIGPDGQVRCSSAAARAAGCAPLNIFGFNTASAAASRFLQTYSGPTQSIALLDGSTVTVNNGQNVAFEYLAKNRQDVVSGSVHGDLFSLFGSSPVAAAVGGEYRREKSSEVYDPFTQAGLTVGNQILNTRGKFNVKEVFGEVVAPILEDRSFVKYLGVEGAVRYADYSTVGGVTSYKGGARYAPTSDIAFRVVYQRAIRAPNIGELFGALGQTFPAINDPCDQGGGEGGEGVPTQALPAGCAALPGVANAVANRGSFTYTTAQLQQIDGLTGGNRNLREETANTITAGAVITPTFVRNLSLTVDYYRIKVKNAVGIIGQQISVDRCFQTGNPLFCDNVVRDANGFITRVNAVNLNTGSLLVSGIDLEGRYSIPFEQFGGSKFDIDIQWNHRLKQQQTPLPGEAVAPELGQSDCYVCGRLGTGFRNRVVGNFTVGNPNFQLYYRIDYLSPVVDNLDPPEDRIRIPHYIYHNVQAKLMTGADRKLELFVGVNNLTDKKPPIFGDTNQVTFPGTQTVANTYDLYGRLFYAGATFSF